MEDPKALGEAYFQASLIAERDGHWVLARTYAERAKAQYEELADRMNVGRLLNNLGGLEFLLGQAGAGGRPAAARLSRSRSSTATTTTSPRSSPRWPRCAQDRRSGRGRGARRHALRRLGDREDRLEEIGNARLVLGRALLEQGRLDEAEKALAQAEDALSQLSSGSHRAAAWVAQGDLAERRGDDRRAAALYRRAAEALQDFRF